MALEELLVNGTLLLLLASAFTLVVHLFKASRGRKAVNDFSILMLVFISGWFSTDLVAGWDGGVLELPANLAYLSILVVFALVMTRRLNWAVKQVVEPVSRKEQVAEIG